MRVSLRIAEDFKNSVCVMMESNYGKVSAPLYIKKICKLNTSIDNVILLNHHCTINSLQKLSEVEKFDVVIAMNVAHYFKGNMSDIIDTIRQLGDHIFFEYKTDQSCKLREIESKLNSIKNINFMGTFSRPATSLPGVKGKLYYFPGFQSGVLKYRHLLRSEVVNYKLYSDFKTKQLFKRKLGSYIEHDWVPGINMVTFKCYNGKYPSCKRIMSLIDSSNFINNHPDPVFTNLILQGNKIHHIDFDTVVNYNRAAIRRWIEHVLFIKDPEKFKKNYTKIKPLSN